MPKRKNIRAQRVNVRAQKYKEAKQLANILGVQLNYKYPRGKTTEYDNEIKRMNRIANKYYSNELKKVNKLYAQVQRENKYMKQLYESNVNKWYNLTKNLSKKAKIPFVEKYPKQSPLWELEYDELRNKVTDEQFIRKFDETAKEEMEIIKYTKALTGYTKSYTIRPETKSEKLDYDIFLRNCKKSLVRLLTNIRNKSNIKYKLCLQATFYKKIKSGNRYHTQFTDMYIQNKNQEIILQSTNINELISKNFTQIIERIEQIEQMESGWIFYKVKNLFLNTAKYIPLSGSTYIDLPKFIKKKKAVLNIKNNDCYCFKYCIIAGRHPISFKKHPDRVKNYLKYVNEFPDDGFQYPFPIDENMINKFEKKFNISINIFGINREILHNTKNYNPNEHYNLLYIGENTYKYDKKLPDQKIDNKKNHYCLIHSMSRLFGEHSHKESMPICNKCLHQFRSKKFFTEHIQYCNLIDPIHTVLPKEENSNMYFKNLHYQEMLPLYCTADFECLLEPYNDNNNKNTLKENKHVDCGYCIRLVSHIKGIESKTYLFRGTKESESVIHFVEQMKEISEYVKEIYNRKKEIIMTDGQKIEYFRATKCYICNKNFSKNNNKVRDHCHITGKYLGASHNKCNLYRQQRLKFLPVIFHNLRGYDSHLIIKELSHQFKNIEVIPNNMEKYMSFKVDNLRFIDSMQFMSSSLSTLVDNLIKEGDYTKFNNMFSHFKNKLDDDKIKLLIRKGVYPYEWYDSFEKFNKPCIWAYDDFYSKLNGGNISKSDYEHYKNVIKILNLKTAGEYHDIYLTTDALLLADVWENFRQINFKNYGLDASWYVSAPSVAWDSALKKCEINLKLLTDPTMHLIFENGIRGGISTIFHRYAKANNKYMKDYNPNEKSSYIMYLDANSLYGGAMSMDLPYNHFEFVDEKSELYDINNINKLYEDKYKGYLLVVDLEYPKELHDKHNDYPLAPEKITVNKNMVSNFTKKIHKELNMKINDTELLVGTLNNKKNYIIHYKLLKLYMDLGLKLTKIHKIIKFSQKPWLKPYIEYNTQKRKEAKNAFEKDYYKLMINSVYGKTMENVRKHQDIKIVTDPEKLKKLVSKPSYDNIKIFDENCVAVHMKKNKVTLNKPIYIGFTVLELSKYIMFDFHYNVMKKKYGDNIKLLFTDTDSLCYQIFTDDIYKDLESMKSYFDFSEYPKENKLFDMTNARQFGKFKDESKGDIINEFIGLRSKMYSYTMENDICEHYRAKGVNKKNNEMIEKKRKICHDDYKRAIFGEVQNDYIQIGQQRNIKSDCHNMYSIKLNKVALSSLDTKRFVLDDNIHTRAYGHYKNKNQE